MTPTTSQFIDSLQNASLTERQRSAIVGVYSFPMHEASAPQLAALLGFSRYSAANLAFGKAGRTIATHLDMVPPERNTKYPHWWSILSTFNEHTHTWTLLPELVEAIRRTGIADESPFDSHPDDTPAGGPLREGATTSVTVAIYERSAVARRKCVEYYGCACCICRFLFETAYGELGRDYIHVHHVVPLAQLNKEYDVDPVRDLRPVCPNCHAMLHRRTPALSVDELKQEMNPNRVAPTDP